MPFRKFLPAVLVPCLVAAACSGHKASHTPPGVTGAVSVRVAMVRVGGAEVVSPARATRPMDDATIKAGVAVTQQFFDATVLDPLTKGRAGSIDAVFTADAVRQAATADRAAMYDEGVPQVSRIDAKLHAVQLTGLADDADRLAIVIAKFAWDVTGDGSRVHIVRRGELTLTPAFGSWFVSAYEVDNVKTVGGATTTTSAVKP